MISCSCLEAITFEQVYCEMQIPTCRFTPCNHSKEILEDLMMSSNDLSIMHGLANHFREGHHDALLKCPAQTSVFTALSCQPARASPEQDGTKENLVVNQAEGNLVQLTEEIKSPPGNQNRSDHGF